MAINGVQDSGQSQQRVMGLRIPPRSAVARLGPNRVVECGGRASRLCSMMSCEGAIMRPCSRMRAYYTERGVWVWQARPAPKLLLLCWAALLQSRPPSQWPEKGTMLDAQRMFHPLCSGCITANWSTNISHGPSQRIHNEKAISSAWRPVRTASWQPPSV
jgi:hypothetical protein